MRLGTIFRSLLQKQKKICPFTKDILKGANIEIGEYTYGIPSILFDNPEVSLKIGKFCSISGEVTIFLGGNHRYDWVSTYPFSEFPLSFPEARHIQGHPSTNGNVSIGNDVWIGRGVTILSGVSIADGAVIGTNSLVTKDIGPYEIWGGNPASLLKHRFSEKIKKKILMDPWWEWDIIKIRKNIQNLMNKPE